MPVDGELQNIHSIEINEDEAAETNDEGPAQDQTDPGHLDSDCQTASTVLLQDPIVNIQSEKEKVLNNIIINEQNKKSSITIPWPTRNNLPVSEFTTRNFLHLHFLLYFQLDLGIFSLIDSIMLIIVRLG